MKMPTWMFLSALSGLMVLPACGPGYTELDVGVESRARSGIVFYDYSARDFGDWRVSYRQWTPVVIYEYNGVYYPRNVRGARAVMVYRSPSGYFLPPRDQDWARTDRRFNNKRRPTAADYGRARPRPDH